MSTLTVYSATDIKIINDVIANRDLIVLGGGLLAAETAANLLMKQKTNKIKSTTIIMREKEPLAEMYGEKIGKVIRGRMEELGVKIISGSNMIDSDKNSIHLANGTKISHKGALVVNAVGTFLGDIGHNNILDRLKVENNSIKTNDFGQTGLGPRFTD